MFSVEYADSTPTLRVSGISVGFGRFVPAATVSGISWENGVLDPVVKLWEIIVGMFSCVGIPAPRGVGGFGGMMEATSSRDSEPRVSTGPKRRTPVLGGGRRTARPQPEVIPRSRGTGGDFRGRPQNLPIIDSCVLTRP